MEHSVKTTNAYVYEATLVITVEQVCWMHLNVKTIYGIVFYTMTLLGVTIAICLHWTIPIKRQDTTADINIDQAVVNVNFVHSSQSTSWWWLRALSVPEIHRSWSRFCVVFAFVFSSMWFGKLWEQRAVYKYVAGPLLQLWVSGKLHRWKLRNR